MNKDRGDQLALGYTIGLPVDELATAYEVSRDVVLREVKERNIPLRAEDRPHQVRRAKPRSAAHSVPSHSGETL